MSLRSKIDGIGNVQPLKEEPVGEIVFINPIPSSTYTACRDVIGKLAYGNPNTDGRLNPPCPIFFSWSYNPTSYYPSIAYLVIPENTARVEDGYFDWQDIDVYFRRKVEEGKMTDGEASAEADKIRSQLPRAFYALFRYPQADGGHIIVNTYSDLIFNRNRGVYTMLKKEELTTIRLEGMRITLTKHDVSREGYPRWYQHYGKSSALQPDGSFHEDNLDGLYIKSAHFIDEQGNDPYAPQKVFCLKKYDWEGGYIVFGLATDAIIKALKIETDENGRVLDRREETPNHSGMSVTDFFVGAIPAAWTRLLDPTYPTIPGSFYYESSEDANAQKSPSFICFTNGIYKPSTQTYTAPLSHQTREAVGNVAPYLVYRGKPTKPYIDGVACDVAPVEERAIFSYKERHEGAGDYTHARISINIWTGAVRSRETSPDKLRNIVVSYIDQYGDNWMGEDGAPELEFIKEEKLGAPYTELKRFIRKLPESIINDFETFVTDDGVTLLEPLQSREYTYRFNYHSTPGINCLPNSWELGTGARVHSMAVNRYAEQPLKPNP